MARMRWSVVLAAMACVACGGGGDDGAGSTPGEWQPPAGRSPIGMSFPPAGLETVSQGMSGIDFTRMHMSALRSDYLRYAEDWTWREPSQGQFDASVAVERLQQFQDQAGFRVLLTIQSNGPSWRCLQDPAPNDNSCVFSDNTELAAFVTGLLQAYGGTIHRLQFGNEMLSPDFYVGTPQQYVDAFNAFAGAARAASPGSEIVLGGFSTGSLRRYAACTTREEFRFYGGPSAGWISTRAELDAYCGEKWVQDVVAGMNLILDNADYDVVDLHLYDDPESWSIFHGALRAKLGSVSFLVSEFGGPHSVGEADAIAADPEGYHRQRLEAYLDALTELGIESAYYFKLVEAADGRAHQWSGLIRKSDLQPKLGYYTVEAFNTLP